jgi:hypothetical protein
MLMSVTSTTCLTLLLSALVCSALQSPALPYGGCRRSVVLCTDEFQQPGVRVVV